METCVSYEADVCRAEGQEEGTEGGGGFWTHSHQGVEGRRRRWESKGLLCWVLGRLAEVAGGLPRSLASGPSPSCLLPLRRPQLLT